MTAEGRVRLTVVVALAALLAALTGGPARAQQAPPPIVIKELTVEGNRRVQEAVILGRVSSSIGGPFNPSQLSEDLRNIFALGFFDDVQMKIEDFEGGVKVTFVVVERPFVRDVDFVGNKRFNTTELQEKIDLKLGSVYNPVDVQTAREKLKNFYEDEGYFEVQITPDVEKFADGDVRVVFSISEGRRMTIERIVLKGNKGLSDRQIKAAMATQERQFFILRGTVQRQKLEEDVERILILYNDHGYIQARVDSHDVSIDRDKARVTLTFVIVEGPQFRVGEITFAGVTLFPESEVRRQLRFKTGDVFSRGKLRDSLDRIAALYSTIGRASADVNPRTEQTPQNTVNLVFELTEGPEVYVERINISGNTRSQDKILRREIPMVEGDLFTLQKLERAKQRLTNLGYFETVKATTQPGSDKSKIIVNIDVTERPTGVFSIGGGFSSVDSFIGTVDLAQNNFLGRGWQASVRLRGGATSQQGIISFTEPWLFDRPLAAGFDLYNTRRIYTEFDYETLGGNLRLSHPFAEYWRWFLLYRLSRDEISNLRVDANSVLTAQETSVITSLLGASVVRDSRDSIQTPTKGGTVSVAVDVAGLGGDQRYVKSIAAATYFKPIWLTHILSGRIEGGYAFGLGDQVVPLYERFYLGGPNSIRSFKFRQISPIDSAGFRVGGNSEVLGNLEYIVPLPFNIRLAAFFDVGNAYGNGTDFDLTDVRKAGGGGLRWVSPFGPIRLDYGINLDRKTGEQFGAFHFSVGSPF